MYDLEVHPVKTLKQVASKEAKTNFLKPDNDYDDVMKKLKPLGHIHSHFTGIIWGPKGEKKHENLKDEDIKSIFTFYQMQTVVPHGVI